MAIKTDNYVTIRFPEKLKRELQKLADDQYMKLSQYIRIILIKHLKEEKN